MVVGGTVAVALAPCPQCFLLSGGQEHGRNKNGSQQWRPMMMMMMMNNSRSENGKLSTFKSSIATDLPLYESPVASFNEYLNDRPRVFRAMFPDKDRSQRLNDEVWRIKMLPLEFFLLSVRPVIDMQLRCKSKGTDYPPGVPLHVTKVLELQATRWELQGLESVIKPTRFALSVRGALYSERQGIRSRLKGQLELCISCVVPPALALVPEDVLRSISESVLKRLVENMKQKVNESLLSDFRDFSRERLQRQRREDGHPAS
ncbi:uncharacterized protein LOC143849022 isoform X1 [Tasmannia lanceolata]|uniref:uncharacterized protein LOC143849022 isoform X1 n=1 Tax=Tasmannia lanceolata TaxID=3420 RepID=UPI004063CD8A